MPSKKAPAKTGKKASAKDALKGKTPEETEEGLSPAEIYKKMQEKYPSRSKVDVVSTGCIVLDGALNGGYPRGRIVEMAGQTGTGKSTILLHGCLDVCLNGGDALYIDTEYAVNDSLMEGIGLDKFDGKHFFLHKAKSFAEADEILSTYLKGRKPPVLAGIDSAQALLPSKKVFGGVEDAEPGLQARHMTTLLQKYKGTLAEMNTGLVIINQIRMKFKKGPGGSWIVKEDTAGGNALRFYSDIRLLMKAAKPIMNPDDPEDQIGSDVYVKCQKNKLGKMRDCGVPVIYGSGISNIRSLAFYLVNVTGGVTQNGAWFEPQFGSTKGEKLKGKDAFNEWIKAHLTEITDHLKAVEFD